MKNPIVLLGAVALLASCNNGGSANRNVETFKKAQKAESEKGNIGYRLEGHAEIDRNVGGTTYSKLKIQGLKSNVILNRVPAELAGLNFDYLNNLAASAELKFSNFEISEYPGTERESSFVLGNSNVVAYVNRNVGYLDLTGISLLGAKANGSPINDSYGRKWKINGLFPSENPLDFVISQDMFETYVMPLFTFSNGGDKTKANMDLDYAGVESYYVAIKLAMYAGEHHLNPLDKDTAVQNELGRVKNMYKLEVAEIFSEDFHVTIAFDFSETGIHKFALSATGEIHPNGLTYEDESVLETIALDVDVSLHAVGKNKMAVPSDPNEYISVR